MDSGKEVGGPGQVLDGQFEEQFLAGAAGSHLLGNRGVVGGGVFDRQIEDRRVGSEARYRELVDIAGKRAVVEHVAGDVVEPEARSGPVQGGGDGGHDGSSSCW